MKPVLVTRGQLEPRRLEPVGGGEERPRAEPRRPARAREGAERPQANGASVAVEIAKRTARNANSG